MIGERVHHLAVHHVEQLGPLVHHRDLGPDRREHRGVLDPDDPGSHHQQLTRQGGERKDVVAREHSLVVDRDPLRNRRGAAAGDHHEGRLELEIRFPAFDHDLVRSREARRAIDDPDSVALQLGAHHVPFALHDDPGAQQQILGGDLGLAPIGVAVERSLAQPRQIEDGLAQGLARDGAGVDAHSADLVASLDDHDLLAQLGGLDGGSLPGGTTADHHQIYGLHGSSSVGTATVRLGGSPRESGGKRVDRVAVEAPGQGGTSHEAPPTGRPWEDGARLCLRTPHAGSVR